MSKTTNTVRKALAVVIAVSFITGTSGCATKGANVPSSYVPQGTYDNTTCATLGHDIIDAQQQLTLQQLELNLLVNKILEGLKDREKKILAKRYGLQGQAISTLKTVGEEQNLTRERVRQIESEALAKLGDNLSGD